MEITTTLNEIVSLNLEDRIQLVQAIWDSIAAEQAYPELTEAQNQELDNRINDHDINPDNTIDISIILLNQQRCYNLKN
jgi:putative addiction module component (TIGR02574 family)